MEAVCSQTGRRQPSPTRSNCFNSPAQINTDARINPFSCTKQHKPHLHGDLNNLLPDLGCANRQQISIIVISGTVNAFVARPVQLSRSIPNSLLRRIMHYSNSFPMEIFCMLTSEDKLFTRVSFFRTSCPCVL